MMPGGLTVRDRPERKQRETKKSTAEGREVGNSSGDNWAFKCQTLVKISHGEWTLSNVHRPHSTFDVPRATVRAFMFANTSGG